MTNSCMVLPEPGFHAALRRLTREAGTLLLIDETHTISTGPGGYTRAHGLEPDLFVLGKPVAGGVPASVWGFTDEVARRARRGARARRRPAIPAWARRCRPTRCRSPPCARRSSEVMTDEAYAHMEAARRPAGRRAVSGDRRARLPWHVVRVGARVEFVCAPGPLRNGTRGRGRTCAGAGAGDPPRAAQSRLPDRAVPQHDAGVAGDDRAAGRHAGAGLRRGRGHSAGLRTSGAAIRSTRLDSTRTTGRSDIRAAAATG